MIRKCFSSISVLFLIALSAVFSYNVYAQIPNQLAEDFVAGKAPSLEEVAKCEKEATEKPNDLRVVRRLGKAYFFQFFDYNDTDAVPKSQKTLERALTIEKDDPETLAYLGALHIFSARRLHKKDLAKQKAGYERGFELVKLAEKLAPRHGAVISVAAGSYIVLPESYGMAPHVIEMLEGMRMGMGPHFKKFAHHGQQRLLLTLGQAYAQTGQSEKAKAAFDEALAVNGNSVEAGLIRSELEKLTAGAAKK